MPGGDGTGPMGAGPRMGRGRSMCGGRGAAGMGNQMGQGRRRGLGWQRQAMGCPAFGGGMPMPDAAAPDGQQELQVLQQKAQAMATALENLRKRIEQLQGHKPTE